MGAAMQLEVNSRHFGKARYQAVLEPHVFDRG